MSTLKYSLHIAAKTFIVSAADYAALVANGNPAPPGTTLIDPSTGVVLGVVDGNGVLQQFIPTSGIVYIPEDFGAVHDGVTDDTTAIQDAIDAASAAYNATTGARATLSLAPYTYGLNGLLFKPNVIYNFGQAKLLKVANSVLSGNAQNSIIRTNDTLVGGTTYYGNYDNIDVIGGVLDPGTFSCPAHILRLQNARYSKIVGTRVIHRATNQTWAFCIAGKRIALDGLKVENGTLVFQDGIHITHGEQIALYGDWYSESGDDAVALGNDSTVATETWDDEPLKNVTITGGRVNSANGTLKIYYGVNTATHNPFSGTYRGKIDGVSIVGTVGYLGQLSNGGIYIQDTTALVFNAVFSGGQTSGTLSSNYTGTTGVYDCIFSNADIRQVTLTNGATTATWSVALSAAATATMLAGDPARIKNITISDVNFKVGSTSNDGVNCAGIFGRYATDVSIRARLDITDTASGVKAALGDIAMFKTSEFVLQIPTMPSRAGLSLYDCDDTNIHDGNFNCAGGGANRGAVDVYGSRNVNVKNNAILGLQTSGIGVSVQTVGSGARSNSLSVVGNTFNKGSASTSTRAYIQAAATSGFVTYLLFAFNNLRGNSNATSVDLWTNGSGSIPSTSDQCIIFGNNGTANILAANAVPNGEVGAAYTFSATTTPAHVNGTVYRGTLTGNITMAAPTSFAVGARLVFLLTQDGTGGRTITWNAVFKFTAAAWVDAIVTTDASKVSRIEFEYDGTNWLQVGPNRWV